MLLICTAPDSYPFATLSPVARFSVYTAPVRPYSVSFASASASSSVSKVYSETVGPIRAFVAAGKPIPAYSGQSLMDLSCLAAEHKMTMMSIDAHTWMARNALRKGIAAAQGIDNSEPSLLTLPLGEETTSTDPKLALK